MPDPTDNKTLIQPTLPVAPVEPVMSNPQELVDSALGNTQAEPTVTTTAVVTPLPPPTPLAPLAADMQPTPAPIQSPLGDDTPLAFMTPSQNITTTTIISSPDQQSSYLPPTPPAPLAPPPKSKSKTGIVLGGILLLVLAFGGGLYGYSNMSQPSPSVAPRTPQVSEVTPPTGNPIKCTDPSFDSSICDAGAVSENCVGGGYVIEKKCQGKWCVDDDSNCTSGVSGFPACPPPTKPSCGEFTEPGAFVATNFRGTCGAYFPAAWAVPGAPANCQINCLCCPPDQQRVCKPTGQTYEYATIGNNDQSNVCKSKEDLFISEKANPAYNPQIPPQDQTSLCDVVRQNAKGEDVWRCKTRLTTCAVAACACTGASGMSCTSLIATPATPPVIGTQLTFTCSGAVTPSTAGTLSYKFRYSINSGAYSALANKTATTAELTVAACGSYSVQCQACATLNGVVTCDPTWIGAAP